jgi:hypothetical protein
VPEYFAVSLHKEGDLEGKGGTRGVGGEVVPNNIGSAPPKGAFSGHLPYGRVEEDGRVADIEDVYLGEDGSIQCVVTWKSLVDASSPPPRTYPDGSARRPGCSCWSVYLDAMIMRQFFPESVT